MRETWVQSLGWEGPLEMGTATHSSILTWRIPWKKEPGGLQPMGSQRVRPNWETFTPYIWLWCQALFKIHIYGFKNPLCYNSIYKSVYIYITIVIYNSIYIYIYTHTHTHLSFHFRLPQYLRGKNLPAKQKTRVWSLGQEDPLKEEMATHSSIPAQTIPWTEEPGGLQSMGL